MSNFMKRTTEHGQKNKDVRGMFFDNEVDELREIEEHDDQSPSYSLAPSTFIEVQVKVVL